MNCLKFLAIPVLGFLISCGGGGSADTKEQIFPPSNLVYPVKEIVGFVGTPLPPTGCTFKGSGTFSVAPSLPQGINVGINTGLISGTPEVVAQPPIYYLIHVSNEAGSTSFSMKLSVRDSVPMVVWSKQEMQIPASSTYNESVTVRLIPGPTTIPNGLHPVVKSIESNPGGPSVTYGSQLSNDGDVQQFQINVRGGSAPGTWTYHVSFEIDGTEYISKIPLTVRQGI